MSSNGHALMRKQTPPSAAKSVEQGLSTEATVPYQWFSSAVHCQANHFVQKQTENWLDWFNIVCCMWTLDVLKLCIARLGICFKILESSFCISGFCLVVYKGNLGYALRRLCVHNSFTQCWSQRKPGVKLNIMYAHIPGLFWYALRTQQIYSRSVTEETWGKTKYYVCTVYIERAYPWSCFWNAQ